MPRRPYRGSFNEQGGRHLRINRGFEINLPAAGRGARHGASVGAGDAGAAGIFATSAAEFDFMSGQLDPRITFTHADDNAWRLNSSGVLVPALTDEPRFDWDYETPGAPVNRGQLIEGASTNRCLHSDDFTNAAWVKSNITAAKTQIGPDGVVNSASSLTATSANGTVLQAITRGSASNTFSVYIKRLVGTGPIELTNDAGSTYPVTATVGAGWTRNKITQTIANSSVGIRIVTSGDAIAVAFSQEEARATSTSPIRTTTAAVTRAADQSPVSGTNFTDWYTAGPGTIYCKYMIPQALISTTRGVLALSDGTANEHVRILVDAAGGSPRLQVTDGGALQANLIGAGATARIAQKAAIAFATNDVRGNVDGTAGTPDTSVNLPTVDRLHIGNSGTGSQHFYGWVQQVNYWTRALTTQELDTVAT